MKNIDVVGIGNPLMDVIIKVEHEELAELDIQKGSMHLVSEEQLTAIEERLKEKESHLVPGGSVANTLTGIAMLGGEVVFIGKIGDDEHGKIYEQKLEGDNVKSRISTDIGRTGRVISLVTPDSERTFITFLGACLNLKKENLVEEDIKNAKILHLTGYQLEDSGLRDSIFHAMKIAKEANTKISIDLADPYLVERTREEMIEIIKKADILFANEEEYKVMTGKDKVDIEQIDEYPWIETFVVKLGNKGSIVRHKKEIHHVKAEKVEAVDTTGAGDMYAAAILYGLTNGIDIEKSMLAASKISGRIVETIGARLEGDVSDVKSLLLD